MLASKPLRILVVASFGVLFSLATFSATVQAEEMALPTKVVPPIEWNPPNVECTIGNGAGPTEDIVVTVISHKPLSNVDLRIVPELINFIEATPAHFDTMEPEIPYEVRLRFSVAPGALAQRYSGTIQVRVDKAVVARPMEVVVNVDYGDVVIPSTTKVLSPTTAAVLTSIDSAPTARTLTFSERTNELAALQFGDVLVINVCAAAPMGFLGRITNVEVSRTGAVITTEPATIQDAIGSGTIHVSRELGPGDVNEQAISPSRLRLIDTGMLTFYAEDIVLYDFDGDEETEDDQLLASGSLGVGLSFDFTLGIDWSGVRYVRSVATLREEAEITFHLDIPIIEFEREATIGHPVYFTPIVVWAGFVPVVFVPELRTYVEFEGSASAGVETSIMQDASLSLGLQYEDGEWSPVSEFTPNLEWEPPHFTLQGSVKGSVGPQYNLLLYGLVGPYTEVMGFAELNVEVLPSPSWELYGGIEAGAGVRMDVLGRTIADEEFPTLVDYRVLLAHSETEPGFISGQVTDAVSRLPLGNVVVDVRDQYGNHAASGLSGGDGRYSVSVASGSYRVDFSKPGYLTVNYFGVNISEGETVYLEPVLQIDAAYSGSGAVSGRILSALSGAGVQGITVDLRSGMNSISSPITASTVSGSDGGYRFSNLAAGNYTAEIRASGYVTTHFGIICLGGQEIGNQNAVITPILPPGQKRIVLTWGATPSDLDSHMTGPLPGGSRFHMFYPYAQSNSGSPWPAYVTLDLDDVTSYGPETTTLLQEIPGVYRFSVHNYSNRGSANSTALSSSGALVRVYREGGLLASFPVPTGQGGTLWTVFEMENGVIRPINSFSYESDPGHITSLAANDVFDWSSLPPKAKEKDTSLPQMTTKASLSLIQPNPFTTETSLGYTVPTSGATVEIGIFDVAGRRIITVANGRLAGGSYVAKWDGRDAAGRRVSPGIYFCRAVIGEMNQVKKLVLLR